MDVLMIWWLDKFLQFTGYDLHGFWWIILRSLIWWWLATWQCGSNTGFLGQSLVRISDLGHSTVGVRILVPIAFVFWMQVGSDFDWRWLLWDPECLQNTSKFWTFWAFNYRTIWCRYSEKLDSLCRQGWTGYWLLTAWVVARTFAQVLAQALPMWYRWGLKTGSWGSGCRTFGCCGPSFRCRFRYDNWQRGSEY